MLLRQLLLFPHVLHLVQAQAPAEFPLSESSAWNPIPAPLQVSRSGDQIKLRTKSAALQRIAQDKLLYEGMGGMTLRIDSLEGLPGSRVGASMKAQERTFNSRGITVFFNTRGEGEVETIGGSWVETTTLDRVFSFPVFVKFLQSGGGFRCYLSEDGGDWDQVGSFPTSALPWQYQIMVNSDPTLERTVASFSAISLLGADGNDNEILDGWEICHFGRVLTSNDPRDPDEDGRSNLQEWQHYSDPNQEDLALQDSVSMRKSGRGLDFVIPAIIAPFPDDIRLEMKSDDLGWVIIPFDHYDLAFDYAEDNTFYQFNERMPSHALIRAVFPRRDMDAFPGYLYLLRDDLPPSIWKQ